MSHIYSILVTVTEVIHDWHADRKRVQGLEQFSLSKVEHSNTLPLGVRLAHCNYVTWHLIANEMDAAAERRQNLKRNLLIDQLDDMFFALQKGEGPHNSETLGSIVDRYIVAHLKWLHSDKFEDVSKLKKERDLLAGCAIVLYEQTLIGERQCFRMSRAKLDYRGGV